MLARIKPDLFVNTDKVVSVMVVYSHKNFVRIELEDAYGEFRERDSIDFDPDVSLDEVILRLRGESREMTSYVQRMPRNAGDRPAPGTVRHY